MAIRSRRLATARRSRYGSASSAVFSPPFPRRPSSGVIGTPSAPDGGFDFGAVAPPAGANSGATLDVWGGRGGVPRLDAGTSKTGARGLGLFDPGAAPPRRLRARRHPAQSP